MTLIRHLLAALLIAATALAACSKPAGQSPKADQKSSVSLRGYNFTAEGVEEFFVDGYWAANLPPYGGGGKGICCAMLPAHWSPDLRVTVRWTMGRWTTPYKMRQHLSISEQIKCCAAHRTLTKTVPVQPYDEPSILQVFFLPNDEIEVWVYDAGPQNPGHPSKRGYPKNPNPPPKED